METKAPETKVEPKVELSQEALLALVREMKAPFVDPKLEAQKAREKAEMKAEWDRSQALDRARKDACTHLRSDNTSAIAWNKNSDGITRGVCMHCNDVLAPGHTRYVEMLRVPVRGSGVIYV